MYLLPVVYLKMTIIWELFFCEVNQAQRVDYFASVIYALVSYAWWKEMTSSHMNGAWLDTQILEQITRRDGTRQSIDSQYF